MSTLERLFTTTFTIRRQVWSVDGNDNDVSEEAVIGTFKGYRQQADAEFVANMDLTYVKPHTIWCPVDTAVENGDMIVSSFGDEIVKSIQINRDGRNSHLELMTSQVGDDNEVSS